MTEQDKATIIGRAILEEKKNNETLAALDSQFRDMSDSFKELSYALSNDKHGIVFEPGTVRTPTVQREHRPIPIKFFNLEVLQELLQQHRQCLETKRKLDDELVRLGVRSQPRELSPDEIEQLMRNTNV